MSQDEAKIASVEIRYMHRPSIYITGEEIERMEKAADAIEIMNRAKEIARRLIDVSSE